MLNKKILTVLLATTSLAACGHMSNSNDPMSRADGDMKRVLDAQAALHPKPIETLSAEEARQQPSPADGAKQVMIAEGKDPHASMGVRTRDITIPTANGALDARVYAPANAHGRLPVIVYYHGGGFVIADLDTYDATPRAMAKMVNAVVVSVEYRHAPESRFPAAHNDAFNAYRWVVNHTASIGGDANRIAVMGESAGGNLAINTAIAARDHDIRQPVYEVLVYPVAGTDMFTPSYVENAHAKPLNKPMMAWFIDHTISKESDKQDGRLDLVDNADFHGLPPTTVVTAEIDPLRSEGKRLAHEMAQEGVDVHAKTYRGVTHEFFGMGVVVATAKDAEEDVAADLREAFSK